MPISELRLIKRCMEYQERSRLVEVPSRTHGIYALYKYRPRLNRYDVVYIGMARGPKSGIYGRLISHNRKKADWTHFSIFQVWDNITEQEVEELEGLFRHIYRRDTRANRLNTQRSYKKLKKVSTENFESLSI